jgi:hypothetical protein
MATYIQTHYGTFLLREELDLAALDKVKIIEDSRGEILAMCGTLYPKTREEMETELIQARAKKWRSAKTRDQWIKDMEIVTKTITAHERDKLIDDILEEEWEGDQWI